MLPFERLVDDLWGQPPPDTVRKSLQVRASRLRRALGERVIATRGAGYVADRGDSRLDLHLFERSMEHARRALASERFEEAGGVLREALALWRGEPLQDFAYESFAQLRSSASPSFASSRPRCASMPI